MHDARREAQYIWHPGSQMKDDEFFSPLYVVRARGSYLELKDGKKIIDAISSWWCKSLGHHHPRLIAVLQEQIERFEHVMLANITHAAIEKLSHKLVHLTSSLNKIFYASDGASAIEIAIKMSFHSRKIRGETKKTKFIALQNSYHGETVGALSVSDVGSYRRPYHDLLFDVGFIKPLPYVLHANEKLWLDCSDHWKLIEPQLYQFAECATALIVEPIVQGTGGMKMYSQDFLKRLRQWTRENNIHLIADEIMTGIGRTGKMFACQHAQIEPDFLCLGKGLTAGWMSFSAVMTNEKIYQTFYHDDHLDQSFLHSHTYSGHALSASIALEVLKIIEEENLCERAEEIGKRMYTQMCAIADDIKMLTHVRQIGAIVAADLFCEVESKRWDFSVFQKAAKLGALLRPLGNTIYWLPPLNIKNEIMDELATITHKALQI